MKENLVGQRFTYLTVVDGPVANADGKHRSWTCKCVCGAVRNVREDALLSGKTKSCGCWSREYHTKEIAAGTKFGRLVVMSKADSPDGKSVYWNCKCECGNTCILSGTSLRTGNTKSCGCVKKQWIGNESRTHGMSRTRLYKEWAAIKKRCSPNATEKDRAYYSDLGIGYCEEWEHFEPFKEWALSHGYSDELTIDRIDGSKGYSPENCRWVSTYDQNRNKSNNIWVDYNGKRLCLADAAKLAGLPYKAVHARIKVHGWSAEKALTTPLLKRSKRHSSDEGDD